MSGAAAALLMLLLLAPSAADALDRADELCEACGLIMWRMQTIVTEKAEKLQEVKAAKEKRASKSTKAHSRRWLRQEYAVELSSAIESQIDALPNDQRIIHGACRASAEALTGSALRASANVGPSFHPGRCQTQIRARMADVIGEYQDELTEAAVAGKGAGTACAAVLGHCSAARARHLLGSQYKEDGMSHRELDFLQVGYSDTYTLHTDVDGSFYWFSRSRMKSVTEPPPGWSKREDGKWTYDGEVVIPSGVSGGTKDEV